MNQEPFPPRCLFCGALLFPNRVASGTVDHALNCPERTMAREKTTTVELKRSELFYLFDELDSRIGEIERHGETPASHPSSRWRAELLQKLRDALSRTW